MRPVRTVGSRRDRGARRAAARCQARRRRCWSCLRRGPGAHGPGQSAQASCGTTLSRPDDRGSARVRIGQVADVVEQRHIRRRRGSAVPSSTWSACRRCSSAPQSRSPGRPGCSCGDDEGDRRGPGKGDSPRRERMVQVQVPRGDQAQAGMVEQRRQRRARRRRHRPVVEGRVVGLGDEDRLVQEQRDAALARAGRPPAMDAACSASSARPVPITSELSADDAPAWQIHHPAPCAQMPAEAFETLRVDGLVRHGVRMAADIVVARHASSGAGKARCRSAAKARSSSRSAPSSERSPVATTRSGAARLRHARARLRIARNSGLRGERCASRDLQDGRHRWLRISQAGAAPRHRPARGAACCREQAAGG